MKKLTIDDIKNEIADAGYFIVPDTTTTVCYLTTICGVVVVGKSACIREEDFCEATGRSVAYEDAERQLWALLGFYRKKVSA